MSQRLGLKILNGIVRFRRSSRDGRLFVFLRLDQFKLGVQWQTDQVIELDAHVVDCIFHRAQRVSC